MEEDLPADDQVLARHMVATKYFLDLFVAIFKEIYEKTITELKCVQKRIEIRSLFTNEILYMRYCL